MDRINEQFQLFMSQKDALLGVMRETHKKVISQIEDMRLPDLSAFLNDKYASIQNQQFVCDTCNSAFTTKRSLASHKKMHKTKSMALLGGVDDSVAGAAENDDDDA